jgi:hypothetical protein
MDSVTGELRQFLTSPARFARTLPAWQREAWLAGLQFAGQVLAARPLRAAQRAAREGSANDRAALVLGPPGTGKTFLLAAMVAGFVRAMRGQGRTCRVLFTGFTRESISNCSAKLLFDAINLPLLRIRLGDGLCRHQDGVSTVAQSVGSLLSERNRRAGESNQ